MNWDQTVVKFVPYCTWTMERQGTKQVEVISVKDNHQCSVALSHTTSFRCSSYTKERHHVAILISHSLQGGTSHTPLTTSQQRRPSYRTPYCSHVEKVRETLDEDKPAPVILDNFKGKSQSPSSVFLMPTTSTLAFCHQILLIVSSPRTLQLTNPLKSTLRNSSRLGTLSK